MQSGLSRHPQKVILSQRHNQQLCYIESCFPKLHCPIFGDSDLRRFCRYQNALKFRAIFMSFENWKAAKVDSLNSHNQTITASTNFA